MQFQRLGDTREWDEKAGILLKGQWVRRKFSNFHTMTEICQMEDIFYRLWEENSQIVIPWQKFYLLSAVWVVVVLLLGMWQLIERKQWWQLWSVQWKVCITDQIQTTFSQKTDHFSWNTDKNLICHSTECKTETRDTVLDMIIQGVHFDIVTLESNPIYQTFININKWV